VQEGYRRTEALGSWISASTVDGSDRLLRADEDALPLRMHGQR
jgi:hypothetical protein